MNDTPGWASPGSAPSDGQEPDTSGTAQPTEQPSDQGSKDQPDTPSKWSKEQPPPGQWSAPSPQDAAPGQAPPPPPGPGWGGQHPGGPGGSGGQGGYGGAGYGSWGGQGPGYGGPGGPGGWGGNWGGPPPAAKPGVIPLRPLGVGEILDGAVSTMRTYWRTVLGISLTVAVVTQIAVILLQGFVLDDSATSDTLNDSTATVSELSSALGTTLASSGAVLLITLLGTIIATALLTTVTSRAVLGKPVTTSEAWRDARPQLAKLFGLTILLPLIAIVIVGVGTLPGVLIGVTASGDAGIAVAVIGGLGAGVVALWLMIRFSLASPALMLEKQSVFKSMSRSAKLVRGSWWRVLGIQLLATIIANIMASIIVIPFAVIAAALSGDGLSGFFSSDSGSLGWTFLIVSGIGSVIGSMLTFPITAGVTVLLYIDQRIRREALDLDLARAAGLQEYGSSAPGTTPGS
ncbi:MULTISPECIES: glycerophosphoryl diester phosphodiesterase membrane domain-containing protein [unclassified Streptomyces]|uniref:glycerophosphoryl diester phosphodiesterase membrane domain-containing protein n=1 Tax=unclassified Streptomyces TaxID=2593676 RepID=UPI002DDBCDC6|nr:glycerophosphoryl diester phosphodiesterase membrane domain-containing protein [Streptomyces sp. NBC_00243]WRZ22076.1 glycerophosphoryl diester phosphodiesterase membrane domain-containing protein [Streptomyces sp. NBC_00243]